MGKMNDLLKFLLDKKITIRQAMEILEAAEKILLDKRKEKAVITGYEKRQGD
jgi:hypothetical protein